MYHLATVFSDWQTSYSKHCTCVYQCRWVLLSVTYLSLMLIISTTVATLCSQVECKQLVYFFPIRYILTSVVVVHFDGSMVIQSLFPSWDHCMVIQSLFCPLHGSLVIQSLFSSCDGVMVIQSLIRPWGGSPVIQLLFCLCECYCLISVLAQSNLDVSLCDFFCWLMTVCDS